MIREDEVGEDAAAPAWLSVEVVREGGAFAALRPEWDALLDESGAGVFNAWEWLYPWYRRLGADRVPWILTARSPQGRLLGLMPLCLEARRVWGRTVRRLAFLGETHVGSDYLDVVAHRGLELPAARIFAAALRGWRSEWDVLDLVDLDGASPTVQILREAFRWDHEVRVTDRYECPYETLAAEPFDGFLRRTGRRDNYLRRRRWLERQPGYRIEKVEAPARLARALVDFQRLHALRWAEDGGSQGIKGPSVEAFHRDAAELLAERGRLRMYTLKLGGEAVASVYGLLHGGRFLYFQSGYDPAWRAKSVGLVLVGETFKDSLEAGLTEYDFLRGTEPYKAEWTTKRRRTVAVRVHGRCSAGRWLTWAEQVERLAREVAKRVLPTQAVERLRRLRRRLAAV